MRPAHRPGLRILIRRFWLHRLVTNSDHGRAADLADLADLGGRACAWEPVTAASPDSARCVSSWCTPSGLRGSLFCFGLGGLQVAFYLLCAQPARTCSCCSDRASLAAFLLYRNLSPRVVFSWHVAAGHVALCGNIGTK